VAPVYIVVVSEDEDFQQELEAAQSRWDDLVWSRRVMRDRFAWQGFFEWWSARRWIRPRDVRKG